MIFGDSTATGFGCRSRRRGARRAAGSRTGRRDRQANPLEHQGDSRRHVQRVVGPGGRDVCGRAPAGRRGHHDRRKRHHRAQRRRTVGATVGCRGAAAACQRRRGGRGHLPRLRGDHRDPATSALGCAHPRSAAGPGPGRGRPGRRRGAGAARGFAGTGVSASARNCCFPRISTTRRPPDTRWWQSSCSPRSATRWVSGRAVRCPSSRGCPAPPRRDRCRPGYVPSRGCGGGRRGFRPP